MTAVSVTKPVSTKLTPINPDNARVVDMMAAKAVCAYANWQAAEQADFFDAQFRHESQYEVVAAHRSEYEATVRCVAMLVRESVPTICLAIISQAKSEFGV